MDIKDYIESGIIERYVMGLASTEQEAELMHLRRLYPILDVEIAATELRIESRYLEDAVMPPAELKNRIIHRIRWEESGEQRQQQQQRYHNGNTHQNGHTYINIQPGWGRNITISIWWRCAFIALSIMVMSLLASTWYFYTKTQQLENRLFQLGTPATTTPAGIVH